MRSPLSAAALLLLTACGGHAASPASLPTGRPVVVPTSGPALLRLMHDTYVSRWYHTLTFVQTSTFPDGHQETWHEALRLPGQLRIDVAPLDSGNMSLFRSDSVYTFAHHALLRASAFVHPLLVLGFDVYAADPDSTAAKLAALGFDLTRLHSDTWQGRPAWVVGAAEGDSLTPQFWVDAERLVFVRLIERRPPPTTSPKRPASRLETRFNRYQRLGGGWISPEVLFLVNGELRLKEEYHDMRADVALPDTLFMPDRYRTPEWVNR